METDSDRPLDRKLDKQSGMSYKALQDQVSQVGMLLGGLGKLIESLNGNATWAAGLQVASALLLVAVRFRHPRR